MHTHRDTAGSTGAVACSAVRTARATRRDLADDRLASVTTSLALGGEEAVEAAAAGERGGGAALALGWGGEVGREGCDCQLRVACV